MYIKNIILVEFVFNLVLMKNIENMFIKQYRMVNNEWMIMEIQYCL